MKPADWLPPAARPWTVALVLLLAACAPAPFIEGAAPGGSAAVATPDSFGTTAAQAVLQRGGNAIDAAVATAFVLAVTYPEAGNLGGGGFMTIYHHGEPAFLDYRETAPLAATRDMYLDAEGDVIADASVVGHRATGVPGTVAGLWMAHQRFGRLPWRELVAPAIELARDGFVPSPHLAERVQEERPTFTGRTNFDRYFAGLRAGVAFRQPELAATLQLISERGAAGFYGGRTAELIAAEMRRSGGLLGLQDLADYHALWREPLAADWRRYRLISAPPPSSGGFALIQLLGMKEALAGPFAGLAHNSTQYVHLVAEMEKRVFADRAEYLGDPGFVDAPMARLIDPRYIARRAAEVRPDTISPLAAVRPGLEEGRHTTHFSILDGEGNAVANTYTLNGWFGNGVVVEGAGFLLNNEMDDFSVKPGAPNLYGVVGGSANEIQPGKRMLSSMSPTILLRDGRVAMVIGTPGGSTIFTSVFQAIINILEFGMTPQQAVAAPRFHHQLLPPDEVIYSPCCALPEATITGLRERGYSPRAGDWEFGDVQVIWVDAAGQASTGSDPRGRGEGLVLRGDTANSPPR
jgi:gamma-glutamyltranspeptidase/glutathione hydrolase